MLRKLLQILGRWVVASPRRVLALYAVAAVVSLVGTVLLLGFKTDQNDLVAADVEYNRRYLRLLADFEDIEYLYVVVQVKGETEKAVRVSQAVYAKGSLCFWCDTVPASRSKTSESCCSLASWIGSSCGGELSSCTR